jgi:hypothetical protein
MIVVYPTLLQAYLVTIHTNSKKNILEIFDGLATLLDRIQDPCVHLHHPPNVHGIR